VKNKLKSGKVRVGRTWKSIKKLKNMVKVSEK